MAKIETGLPEQEKIVESQQEAPQENESKEEKKAPSRIFVFLSRLVFLFLSLALCATIFMTVLTLDFLGILKLRQKIPENMRSKWPFSSYLDFVQLHQLPEEERYQQLIAQEQERYHNLITQGNLDLKQRSNTLEDSYRGLLRTQKEDYNRKVEELRKQREAFILDNKKLKDQLADLEKRKIVIDELSKNLASETLNVESSLIRFMEQENQLDQVRNIAAQMDPKALATIFNEVTDDKLIYDILSGLNPAHAGQVLSNVDPEKAGKVMRLGKLPKTLPSPGPSRDYVPPGLQNLINDTQANLR